MNFQSRAGQWWTRWLSGNTLYSMATGALALAFGAANAIGVALGSLTLSASVLPWCGVIASVAVLSLMILRGKNLHPSAGLLLVSAQALVGTATVWVGADQHNVLLALQAAPICVLFVAGFYRPVIARTFTTLALTAISGAMLLGNLGGQWTSSTVGPANLPSTIIFAWICCEAGIVLHAWFEEKTRIDPLTGILNRAGFMDAAGQELARAQRAKTSTSVVLIDIDDFKKVNDTRGHRAGDLVLKELATHWMSLTRANDIIGRIGGDEFALLLPNTPRHTAELVVSRLRARTPHPWSYGITEVAEADGLAEVLHRADTAMYQSRRSDGARASLAADEASGSYSATA